MPIIKNKLFVFGVYEKIENGQASPGTYTLPTAAERLGDFSQSLTTARALRVIYDPASTVGANRTPFAGNIIPVNRQDPVSRKLLANLWNPTSAGDDATGLNNFKYLNELNFHYYNYSARVDYYISENLKVFGRISRLKTDQDQDDFTNGQDPLKMRNVTGSKRNGWNIAGDAVYTINPTTVVDVRGSFYKVEDKRDYPALGVTEADYSSIWSTPWWKSGTTNYMEGRPLIYFPHIQVDATTYGNFGVQNFWYQQPDGYSIHARVSKYLNKHSLEGRRGSPLQARQRCALLLRRLPLHFAGNRQGLHQGGRRHRNSLGEFRARRTQSFRRQRSLQRPPECQYRDVRLLLPGRLQDQPQSDPESWLALRVRRRALGSPEPLAAATRPERPDSGSEGGCRPANARRRQGEDGGIGPGQDIHLQRRFPFHRERQRSQDSRVQARLHAAHRRGMASG